MMFIQRLGIICAAYQTVQGVISGKFKADGALAKGANGVISVTCREMSN